MTHNLIIILIIFLSGIFGGTINFFRVSLKEDRILFNLLKSVFTGLGASILVPLFLNMMSSDLIESSSSNPSDYYLIIGFCLISAIFSNKFIDSIGERVLNQINKVSTEVDNVKSELREATTEEELLETPESKDEYSGLNKDEIDILVKIYESKYTYRSISGITSEVYLPKEKVKELLEELAGKNLVLKILRRKNVFRWKLSEKGRKIVAEKYDDESSAL